MKRKQWPPAVVARLDELTDQILERVEDPTDHGRMFDRRGMVVGQVQSGKTANYTGLICKAADTGYKLFIILAGLHNNLRAQTQTRLDEEFLGFDTAKFHKSSTENRIGVAGLPGEMFINVASLTTRLESGDFKTAVARGIGVHPGAQPILLIVKKNKTVLENIVNYFKNSPLAALDNETGNHIIKGIPTIVIDDEADNASVNTGEVPEDDQGEYNPTTINRLIRQILSLFSQKAYVGYTATPFANIFIHPEKEHNVYGKDLFPRSFIINLPAPSNYFGPVTVFGMDGTRKEGLPVVRMIDDYKLFIPDKHDKNWKPELLPLSLRNAIRSFLLTCAIRRVRGQDDQHNSMLIHVTRFVDVQSAVYRLVEEELTDIKHRIRYGEGSSTKDIINELKEIWESDYVVTSMKMGIQRDNIEEWKAIKDNLLVSVEKIKLKQINGTAADILDYKENEAKGLNVIAIGGDKLSRGLTLEGLSISYYLRASKMYDTLMQMGRWFGYRSGYTDLCRIYTSADLIEWYRHVTGANEELRELFDLMASHNETPENFGLRVRSHSVMMITSRVKMRNAMKLKLSYDGDIAETVTFDPSEEFINHNYSLTDNFIKELGGSFSSEGGQEGKKIWRGIGGTKIIDFVKYYRTHPDAPRANSRMLAEYIAEQVKRGELIEWVVALSYRSRPKDGDGTFESTLGGIPINCVEREMNIKDNNKFTIGRLVSPADEGIDLTSEERLVVEENIKKAGKKSISGAAVRSCRPKERGLMLIYPLDPNYLCGKEKLFDIDKPIIGIALSFPESDTAIKIDYQVNNIYWNQENYYT